MTISKEKAKSLAISYEAYLNAEDAKQEALYARLLKESQEETGIHLIDEACLDNAIEIYKAEARRDAALHRHQVLWEKDEQDLH